MAPTCFSASPSGLRAGRPLRLLGAKSQHSALPLPMRCPLQGFLSAVALADVQQVQQWGIANDSHPVAIWTGGGAVAGST